MKNDSRKFHSLDVRPLIARGEEPFQQIMAAVATLKPNEGLLLIAPFLPSPLIERMRSAGYEVRPERGADGAWKTFFWRD